MLITIKQDQPKVALGLLSYWPEFVDYEAVQAAFAWYHDSDERQLFLWQDRWHHHPTAVIGTQRVFNTVVVRVLAFGRDLTTQDQRQTRGQIFNALQQAAPDKVLVGTPQVQPLITEWREQLANA